MQRTRTVNFFLWLFIFLFIATFSWFVYQQIDDSRIRVCSRTKVAENRRNLRFFARHLHYIVAGKLIKCRDQIFLIEFYSEKMKPSRGNVDVFANTKDFHQLQEDSKMCVLMVSISKSKSLAQGRNSHQETIHLWTDLEKFQVLDWNCEAYSQAHELTVIIMVKKFLLLDEDKGV